MSMWLELGIVVGLILLNGFFALAEMAVVSSRKLRLQQMAEAGDVGAARARALSDDPGRFLSSVQVGITLIGILSGAFGGATLGARLGGVLNEIPAIQPHGQELAFAIVVFFITGLSVVIGELVPKRLALSNPEPIASRVARPLEFVAGLGRPLVWAFERSTALVLRILGIRDTTARIVTEEEVKIAIAEGTEAGVIDEVEEDMIHGVLALADRPVTALMTPRPDIYWIDLDDDAETIRDDIANCPYARVVVTRDGDMTHPLGVIQKKDLVADLLTGTLVGVENHLREAISVPESISAMRVLEIFRQTPLHVAFVIDEYGDFLGMVTMTDVMRAIAGELPEEHRPASQDIVQREDGTWLVNGRAPITELFDTLEMRAEPNGDYNTVAGLALDKLARIPTEGDAFDIEDWRVEIVDMDGNRIDKLLFTPLTGARQQQPAA